MTRRPEGDSSPSTHLCERAAYRRRARTPAESSHALPRIFPQSGRNLRETFMQAMCLRTPNTQVEKMTRECQVELSLVNSAVRIYHQRGDQDEFTCGGRIARLETLSSRRSHISQPATRRRN